MTDHSTNAQRPALSQGEPQGHVRAQRSYYRPDLDIIRFVAFLAVFCHHAFIGHIRYKIVPELAMAGGFGLCLFFTLSAYLITTLLLRERSKTGTVDLPRFYKRRILRIWPLYITALCAGVLFEHHHGRLHTNGLWYVAAFCMLGNLPGLIPGFASYLWSISVEEQFYVVWPTLMKRLSPRSLFIAAIVLAVLSNCMLAYYGIIHADTWKRVWWNSLVQMDMFAAGILLAIRDNRRLQTPRSWPVRIAGFIAIPAVWFAAVTVFHIKGVDLPAHGPISLCVGFGLVAISCAALIDLMYGIEKWPRALLYLGQISYGLYVFHFPALCVQKRYWHGPVPAMILTIIAAAISYKFFESPFLRLKERYEIVRSGPVA